MSRVTFKGVGVFSVKCHLAWRLAGGVVATQLLLGDRLLIGFPPGDSG